MQVPEKITVYFTELRKRRVIRLCTNKYVLVTIAALVILIIDHNGILTLWKNRREIENQKSTIEKYQKDIATIKSRIQSLTSNRDTIEALAREEYYYHKDDEDIYIVE